jgi:predicted nucleotide-binding protein
LEVELTSEGTDVAITAPTRPIVEEVSAFFSDVAARHQLPAAPVPKPTVFIGHGRSTQWRDLKDHLHDQHGYEVEAYEVGARAGHAIRDILEDMLEKSSFAVLVMTGEDEDAEGRLHARENVVHEIGLFQGFLGFPRAVVLLEDGTEEFSNIQGIHQIRFERGNIRATFGDVLATLRREFGGA